MRNATTLKVLVLLTVFVVAGTAEVPQVISYQGVLLDSQNDPMPDGNYSMTFRIYDTEGAVDSVWAEARLVPVKDGLFSVNLGLVNPLSAEILADSEKWLGVQFGLDPELSPRTLLTSVLFSIKAGLADSALVANTSLDKTVDAIDLVSGTLDTARFSAYDDLISEGAIGNEADQVAAGPHSHVIQGISSIEDAVPEYTEVHSADGWVSVKTVAIPASTIENYFRVWWTVKGVRSNGIGTLEHRLSINGQVLLTDYEVAGLFSGSATFQRLEGTDWTYWWSSFARDYQSLTLDVSGSVTIDLQARAWNSGDRFNVTAGTVVIEYRSDGS